MRERLLNAPTRFQASPGSSLTFKKNEFNFIYTVCYTQNRVQAQSPGDREITT